jgi:hypothetical protein
MESKSLATYDTDGSTTGASPGLDTVLAGHAVSSSIASAMAAALNRYLLCCIVHLQRILRLDRRTDLGRLLGRST